MDKDQLEVISILSSIIKKIIIEKKLSTKISIRVESLNKLSYVVVEGYKVINNTIELVIKTEIFI